MLTHLPKNPRMMCTSFYPHNSPGRGGKMELQELRHLNQDLLRKLKANQEEFKRRLSIPLAVSLALREGAVPERKEVSGAKNQEQQQRFCKEGDETSPNLPEGANFQAAQPDLGSPGKLSRSQIKQQRQDGCPDHAQPRAPRVAVVPSGEGTDPASGGIQRSFPLAHAEAQTAAVEKRKEASPPQRPTPAPAKGKGRSTRLAQRPKPPKSILLTPGDRKSGERKKVAGHVKFVSDAEEPTIPGYDWSAQPFLGYDWIAGLLEMDSSLSEKPDEYFDELQDFRKVNRDACIYDHDLQLDDVNSSTLDQDTGKDEASHQCIYCYRLNKRLFTVPTNPESACPICKTPRAAKPPETLVEPAFVRISVPRATLLPAYKHRIHRRKSFELEDTLALPSHCLAGWENLIRPSASTLSSLDLHSSLHAPRTGRSYQNSFSRVAGGTRTDKLLDHCRVVEFQRSHKTMKETPQEPPFLKATFN